MTFEIFLFIVTILYLCEAGFFLSGLKRNRNYISESSDLFVSVIIAARNEETNLPNCLESAANQTYPNSKYEIIVVNDGSTDRTEAVCLNFVQRYPYIKLINAKEDPNLRGKANALAQGIDAARGEIILITDADCVVLPTWVEQTAKRYGKGIELIGGFTLQKADTPFEGMQSLDWVFILGVAVSSSKLKTSPWEYRQQSFIQKISL